jgi:hypothetical protein
MIDKLILQDGYNTDYIYAIILGMFHDSPCGMNLLLNDNNNPVYQYIQEYVKMKIIYQLKMGNSIESKVINKLRLILYNCGWLKSEEKSILEKGKIDDFFVFFVGKIIGYRLEFSRINVKDNDTNDIEVDIIRLTSDILKEGGNNISELLKKWTEKKFKYETYLCKFKNIPYIIPIYVDLKDEEKRRINLDIMEMINFNMDDKMQEQMLWEIQSLICRDKDNDYYVLIKNGSKWIFYSDKTIPSNDEIIIGDWKETIMREIIFVFYRLV